MTSKSPFNSRLWSVLSIVLLWGFGMGLQRAYSQQADLSFLTTRAEESNFDETTRYDEAVAFVDVAAAQHPLMHRATMGYTTEGRAIPLVVFGDVADGSPESVRASVITLYPVAPWSHQRDLAAE